MPQLPTVKIKHADGFCIINEADYDPKKHQLFDGESKPGTPQAQSQFRAKGKRGLKPRPATINSASQK